MDTTEFQYLSGADILDYLKDKIAYENAELMDLNLTFVGTVNSQKVLFRIRYDDRYGGMIENYNLIEEGWNSLREAVEGEFNKWKEEEEPEACQSAIACQELEDYISQ